MFQADQRLRRSNPRRASRAATAPPNRPSIGGAGTSWPPLLVPELVLDELEPCQPLEP